MIFRTSTDTQLSNEKKINVTNFLCVSCSKPLSWALIFAKYIVNLMVLIVLLLPPLFVSAEEKSVSKNKNGLSSLLNLDLASLSALKVFTANRELTSVEHAPAIVSVITAKQIKQQGLKNLHEILSQVPGFFNATSAFMEPISNRGFVQNLNTNYLLLVDGQSLNNNTFNGLGHLHTMPGLDYIARVEVIRGPGSTLWGAHAAMGIIHIITKNATDIDGEKKALGTLQISLDHESKHQRNILQSSYAKHFENGQLILSTSFLNSNPDWTKSYQAGSNDFKLQTNRQMNLWDFEDSHNINLKINWRNWTLKSGHIKFKLFSPLLTPINGNSVSTTTSEKKWLALDNLHRFNSKFSLNSKIYYKDFLETKTNHFQLNQAVINTAKELQSQNFHTDRGYGAETILHFRNLKHHLMLGISASNMDLSTRRESVFQNSINTNKPIPAINDKNRAIFFEEYYRGIEDWVFTAGLRVDKNHPRGNDTFYLPRVAATYTINKSWNIKYAYNTGYVPPTLQQTRGGISQPFSNNPNVRVKGADKVQKSFSHDLQFFYQNKRSSANITLYYHTLTDIIQFANFGPVTVGGFSNVTLFEINASDMRTKGLELEVKTQLNKTAELYSNYAYSRASYDSRFAHEQGQIVLDLVNSTSIATKNLTVTGTPKHIWNIGINWALPKNFSLNTHYRGWSTAFAKNSNQPTFKRFGDHHYFDLNLSYPFNQNRSSFSVYVKNLFDNDDPIPGGVNSGQVEPQNGRQIGIKISHKF